MLPVAHTFVYVQPVYIQAAEARMPQLKKVALAVGNDLIYGDTYEQELEGLARLMQGAVPDAAAATGALERRLEAIRQHLRR